MSGLFKTSEPKPTIVPPAVMPVPDDELMQKRKRREVAASVQKSGRASTILSDYSGGSDKMGGG